MAFFANTGEFLAQFGDFAAKGFFDPIHLSDSKVGFSIKRHYPSDISYKPAIGQDSKKPDNIATLWVVYTHPDESKKDIIESAVPLRIRVANMSLYRTKHWDYKFDDIGGDCPSKDSVEASAATPKPIELEYPGEYFFNHALNVFVDLKGNTVSGLEILERVFQDHCKTTHLLWGLRLRVKLFAQDNFAGLLGMLSLLFVSILKHLFGRTIEDDDAMAGIFRTYRPEAMKKYDADSLDILGYKASKQVVVLFCAFIIMASIFRYLSGISNDYWSGVGGSEFLSLVHGLFFIWLLDVMVPWLLFYVLNGTIWLRTTVLFMKIGGP
ncbi:MAG: hypothetical protein ACXWFG_14765 [Methylobacter sp.]